MGGVRVFALVSDFIWESEVTGAISDITLALSQKTRTVTQTISQIPSTHRTITETYFREKIPSESEETTKHFQEETRKVSKTKGNYIA